MIYREESTTNSNCCLILRDNHLTSPRHGATALVEHFAVDVRSGGEERRLRWVVTKTWFFLEPTNMFSPKNWHKSLVCKFEHAANMFFLTS